MLSRTGASKTRSVSLAGIDRRADVSAGPRARVRRKLPHLTAGHCCGGCRRGPRDRGQCVRTSAERATDRRHPSRAGHRGRLGRPLFANRFSARESGARSDWARRLVTEKIGERRCAVDDRLRRRDDAARPSERRQRAPARRKPVFPVIELSTERTLSDPTA